LVFFLAGTFPAPRSAASAGESLGLFEAVHLFAYYDANEVRADLWMKGQTLAVRGEIDDIGKDVLSCPYVRLSVQHFRNGAPTPWRYGLFGVQCCFAWGDGMLLADLHRGDIVEIEGVCAGKSGNVILGGCRPYHQVASHGPRDPHEAQWREPMSDARRQAEARQKAQWDAKIDAAKWRSWTVAGKSIEAKFLKAADGNVFLQNHDGQILTIVPAALPQDERNWIERRGWIGIAR
jgi:hypothetical protein